MSKSSCFPSTRPGESDWDLFAAEFVKVLHAEVLRERLRADSYEKCLRWRLSFAKGKAGATGIGGVSHEVLADI